ncbi:MAG TPA: hypothetical protein VJX74_10455 [Blastocatellia bacterium]|nr:hypothetical protein [Blastocatellia bacterium]
MTHRYSRLMACTLTAILVTLMVTIQVAPQASVTTSDPIAKRNRLIAHEWGTFTAIAGKSGSAVKWRPLNGSSDLPSFVYNANGLPDAVGLRHGKRCTKCYSEAIFRMETPVIYFYADRETTVSVRVDFVNGKITEWYPQARMVFAHDPQEGGNPSMLDWGRITVMPGAEENFLTEAKESHYYPARETDAAPIRVCSDKDDNKADEHEKFLFYRGVGTFNLPIAARINGDKVEVVNTTDENISEFILFENRGGKVGYEIHDLSNGNAAIERPALDQTIDSLAGDLVNLLVAEGLYEKEAHAMIKTWRDSWFEEGLRIFYIVPRKIIDGILPLRIEPEPEELARVLVGRMEVITPEMERAIQQQVAKLESASSDIQSIARTIIRKHGRFSEPVLKSILEKTTNTKLRRRIEQIIKTASEAGD